MPRSPGKTGLVLSRFQRALTLLRGTEMYVVELGRIPKHNAAHLIEFLRSRGFVEAGPEAERR